MKKYQPILVEETDFAPGQQRVYRFPNGYGASVVQHPFLEKGMVELAVIRFDGKTSWDITYDTPITNDVMVVKEEELDSVLESISKIGQIGHPGQKVLFKERGREWKGEFVKSGVSLDTPQGWKYYEDMVVIHVLGSEEPDYFGGTDVWTSVHRSALIPL